MANNTLLSKVLSPQVEPSLTRHGACEVLPVAALCTNVRADHYVDNATLPCSILEVLDKGKAAAVTSIVETKDKATGKVIFENQSTVFIRGAGGFGGKRTGGGTFKWVSRIKGSSFKLRTLQIEGPLQPQIRRQSVSLT